MAKTIDFVIDFHCKRSFPWKYGKDRKNYVLYHIARNPGISQGDLHRATHLDSVALTTILVALVDENRIRVERQKTTGRTRTLYYLSQEVS